MRRAERESRSWIRLASDVAALEAGYYFDAESADHVCDFFGRFLAHTTTRRWAGRPFELLPWQRDMLSRLFGWKRPDGTRRFREAFIELPKKQGKTSLAAGLALYGLFEEAGAEVFIGASNRKQSGIMYREAGRMAEASPDLRKLLRVLPSKNTIVYNRGHARIKALSADADSEDGANASLVILDEVHRFANRRLYDVMRYAGAARDQPMLVSITTAGHDRHSIAWELHSRARSILDGATEDLEFFPLIYGADPGDDLDDPATWRKANPSMGVIVSEADFAAEYASAKRIPASLNNFLRLRLGIWTESSSRWLPVDLWDQAADQVGPEWWRGGAPVHAALDLSSVADLTALSLLADDGENYRVASLFFAPEESIERRSSVDGVPYSRWADEGHILETPGSATDHEAIRRKLNELVDSGVNIVGVALDPWNCQHLANLLSEDGFNVQLVRQGYSSLSGPSKELERRLLNGTIRHDGNPCMRWNVGNVAVESDAAGNIKPSKKKSTERIDGVASLVMCLALAMTSGNQGVPTFTVIGPDR